jgi:hypothetical protein
MIPPISHGQNHNEEIRQYVYKRDKMCCQWPGCASASNIDILFLIENENGHKKDQPKFKNGILLCTKHLEIVNLHEKAFGPLIFDLIQLIEFEHDLHATEKMYKNILNP